MPIAVIDLGTNTFHLLIAECTAAGEWNTLFRHRIYVKLGEEGIQRIGARAFERALDAMAEYKILIDAAQIPSDRVYAFGTAAIRTAENAGVLLEKIEKETGIRAQAISGDREAELIYKGVRRAVPFPTGERVLIMDIGGGSVEFIIADRERVFWQESFNVGVAVLRRRFQHGDPIEATDIAAIEAFLEQELANLWARLEEYPTHTLAGASGTFDVIDNFLLDPATKPPLYGETSTDQFEPLCEMLLHSTLEERRRMEKMPPERVEMVTVALVLVRHVLRRANIQRIFTSTYALKEGMLEECLEAGDSMI